MLNTSTVNTKMFDFEGRSKRLLIQLFHSIVVRKQYGCDIGKLWMTTFDNRRERVKKRQAFIGTEPLTTGT